MRIENRRHMISSQPDDHSDIVMRLGVETHCLALDQDDDRLTIAHADIPAFAAALLKWHAENAPEAKHAEPAKDDDGWIEWKGGECPVPGGTVVRYKVRVGREGIEPSGCLRWQHVGVGGDIIAYRIEKEAA